MDGVRHLNEVAAMMKLRIGVEFAAILNDVRRDAPALKQTLDLLGCTLDGPSGENLV